MEFYHCKYETFARGCKSISSFVEADENSIYIYMGFEISALCREMRGVCVCFSVTDS